MTDDDDILGGALLLPLLEAEVITPEQAIATVSAPANRIASELQRLGSLNISIPTSTGGGRAAPRCRAIRPKACARCCSPSSPIHDWCSSSSPLNCSSCAIARTRRPPNANVSLMKRVRSTRPLANRLGVWQLKWELEDLSFRYLDPDSYKTIAGWLASKRIDRERYIGEVIDVLRRELDKVHIPNAEIAGRPKHIYSIWRKMHRKGLQFDQLYDVRAVRVLVDTIADCYAALGIVHGMWPYIPGEFDDYIATPKDNLYRSLHTAVIGPGKLPLEVQIRTREMHAHAELGVAAHWRYKEGGKANPAYEQKIVWLRQVHRAQRTGRGNRRRISGSGALGAVRGSRLCHLAARTKSSICREARHRSISPITSIPTWVIAAGAPRSTAAWCR